MTINSPRKFQEQFFKSRNGYLGIGLSLAILASFLLILYLGPFGGIKSLKQLSFNRFNGQDVKAAQFPIDLKAYYSNTARANNYFLDGFNYHGTTSVSNLWFEQQDQYSFKMYNSAPYDRCHWDLLSWWDDNTFRYSQTHHECGSAVKNDTIYEPPIIFLPRYWDGNSWTVSSSSMVKTTEDGVIVCTGTNNYTASIIGIEEIAPGQSGIHWRTQQVTTWDSFGKCNGWTPTVWQEDYWFYDSLPVDGGQPDKGLKRSKGGHLVESSDNWDVWFDHWKQLPIVATPIPTPPADTTLPTVSITSPTDGATVSKGGTVTVSASATDNVSVTKVEFLVNGKLTCTDSSQPYSCNWRIPGKANTSYIITAKAYDAANNSSSSSISVKSSR